MQLIGNNRLWLTTGIIPFLVHTFVESLARICVSALQTMIQPYSNMNKSNWNYFGWVISFQTNHSPELNERYCMFSVSKQRQWRRVLEESRCRSKMCSEKKFILHSNQTDSFWECNELDFKSEGREGMVETCTKGKLVQPEITPQLIFLLSYILKTIVIPCRWPTSCNQYKKKQNYSMVGNERDFSSFGGISWKRVPTEGAWFLFCSVLFDNPCVLCTTSPVRGWRQFGLIEILDGNKFTRSSSQENPSLW